VYQAKQRESSQPLAVFVRDREAVARIAVLNHRAELLSELFLPGPLTLVLPEREDAQLPVATSGLIGIRISSSPVIEGICRRVDFPLTATSANLSGAEGPGDIARICTLFGNLVELYLDAGPLVGLASTVVSCVGERVEVLREGAISRESIERALEEGTP
jgi:L-threonylcarbamoyladenylate synthase